MANPERQRRAANDRSKKENRSTDIQINSPAIEVPLDNRLPTAH
jgi:hypothetical protein